MNESEDKKTMFLENKPDDEKDVLMNQICIQFDGKNILIERL